MDCRYVGIDVGGSNVAAIGPNRAGCDEVLRQTTRLSDGAQLIDQIVAVARHFGPVHGIGVAVPSIVDYPSGHVRASVNVPLQDVALRHQLEARLGTAVAVDNDATCATLCEAYDSNDEPLAPNVVMITVGTGVGFGMLLNGNLYRGATGAAGELGHTLIAADVSECLFKVRRPFPQPGSVESLASGRTLLEAARGRGLAPGALPGREARNGDPRAQDAVRMIGARLGIAIANVVNIFDPQLVIIGGGVSEAGPFLLEPALASAAQFIVDGVGTHTEYRLARYGQLAGAVGARRLASLECRSCPDERAPDRVAPQAPQAD